MVKIVADGGAGFKDDEGFDILIPYHGQYKLVRELIGSIVLYTRNIPYRITIVDDGSPNAAYFSTLAQLDAIDGVRSEEQRGFGAAVNLGVKATKRPWIVILNSDCRVDELGWIGDMHKCLATMMKSDKVGLVSARTDDPPGSHPLLKCGKEHRKEIPDTISDQPLPMFCCMMPRILFEKVGPLKEYPYGWYEDEEFFWRMKKHGYQQAISGKAWVRHLGGGGGTGATVKELWAQNPEIKTVMENNRLQCLADLKKLFGRR
jgi:GT2 family glycosyltransferase